jgi:RNA-binding protein YhbY
VINHIVANDAAVVCVSSSMIQEIKRIIKDSEIIKYAINSSSKIEI